MSKSLVEMTSEINLIEQVILEHAEKNLGEMPESLVAELDAIKEDLPKKVDSYEFVCTQLNARADALKAVADKFTVAAQSLRNHSKAMRDRIKQAMLDIGEPEVKGEYFRFKVSMSAPKLMVDEENKVPMEFKNIVYKIDNDRLKTALVADQVVPGARLEQGWQLRTYPNTKSK